jgi:hypothetical protein
MFKSDHAQKRLAFFLIGEYFFQGLVNQPNSQSEGLFGELILVVMMSTAICDQ